MNSEIRYSLKKGGEKGDLASLRKALNTLLRRHGFYPDGLSGFQGSAELSVSEILPLMNEIYEIEKEHSPTHIEVLKIRSHLINAEFKRSRLRGA